MCALIFHFLLLNIPLLLASFIHPRCYWRMKLKEEKDLDLGANCVFFLQATSETIGRKDWNKYLNTFKTTKSRQFAFALAFSMDEVNRNPGLLPNMSLLDYIGFGCKTLPQFTSHMRMVINSVLPNYDCTRNKACAVLLTGTSWETAATIETFMNLLLGYQVLLLTFGPFHPVLSDQEQFPLLYQMAPKDISLALAIVSFVLYFKWNWVGLVISDNDQGIQFLSYLRREMEINTVCFAFVNMIPINMESYMSRAEVHYNQIMTSSTNVVIIYGDIEYTIALSVRRLEFLCIKRIWITTSQWDDTMSKRDDTLDSFHGTLTFEHHRPDISGFRNFVQTLNPIKYSDKYLASQEWMYFNCEALTPNCNTTKNCSSNATLQWLMEHTFDMAFSGSSYDIYNAVYAFAHTCHEWLFQYIVHHEISTWNNYNHQCFKLYDILRNIHFTNPVGDRVNMNQREKLQEECDIFYISNLQQGLGIKVKIGSFSPYFPHGQQLHLSVEMMEWATGSKKILPSVCSADCGPGFRKFWKEGMATCCFECSPCPENEISNETNVDQCVMCPEEQYANPEQTHCIDKAVVFLSYEDPLDMALALIALCFTAFTAVVLGVFVKHHDTPIVKANNKTLSYFLLISLMFCFLCSLLFLGRPNTSTCILQQITFGIVFTVAVSTVLAKTITVVLAFKLTGPRRRMKYILISGVPNYIIPTCSLFQVILCTIWLGSSPPFVDIDAQSEHGHIIIVCNKGSVTAFYSVLGYLAFMAMGSFTVAFLARNLPDTFNEAKYLTFSMLVFCCVWVSFFPVYHSTKGMVMVAVEIFSILSSSAGMLGCIFFPKFYIIVLKPERNSIQKFRKKSYS
ncbi:vomeronasal type-2 receptor 116-like isoform X2 [Acomys russatus]|uniref:vomeronasal type-2 receptor 116-like isoform X2 n=1 Tax=Acomys russatus TaxID=60746 RepID=UPI0021E31AD7|nr:vomeronasal type-2 receptor 116-like isoform X2 [Acomys russatus]